MIKTLSYIYGFEDEITIGNTYYFGQLWDGDGDGLELFRSGAVAIYDQDTEEFKVTFKPLEEVSNVTETELMQTLVEVINIL